MTTQTHRHRWWQPPELRMEGESEEERKVTWLELFFDLVFVVVIAELSHSLAGHLTVDGIIGFVLLFIPVWMIWLGGTFYNQRFETGDVSYRFFTFLQMLPVAGLAIFAHDALGDSSTGFALSYAAGRLILIFMWLRGGYHVPAFRPVSNRYVAGFITSVALFVVSVFVPTPWRFVLWAIGLLLDITAPMTTLHLQAKLPRLSVGKLVERFGLFTIIVLGESVVGVVSGVAKNEHPSITTSLAGGLGMALAFGLWWVYFDYVARRVPKPGVWWTLGWGYLHLPLAIAITAAGAGTLSLLTLETSQVPATLRWLACGAIGLTLTTIAIIEWLLRRTPDEPTHPYYSFALKLAGGLAALAIAAVGRNLGPTAIIAGLLVIILVQIVYGVYVWFQRPRGEPVFQ